MIRRKIFALILVLLFTAASMTGCGGCAGGADSQPDTPQAEPGLGSEVPVEEESSAASLPEETVSDEGESAAPDASLPAESSLPQSSMPVSSASSMPSVSSSSSSVSSSSTQDRDNDSSLIVTDMTGRTVRLPQSAERIVALDAADCEILYAIGAGDLLVGRGTYCDYPAQISSLPDVGSGNLTNIEQIIALRPQVLVMTKMSQTEAQVAQLESAGIRVVVTDAQDIDGVYTAIRLLGKVTGKTAGANALVSEMKADFAALKGKAANLDHKKIYFEVSPLQWGLWTAGSGSFMDEIASLLGLENCFSDVSAWAEVSEEQVIARNPDYILTITMYSGTGPSPEEEILSRTGWEDITAVKYEAILNLPNNELSRPGPRLVDGAKKLYSFISGVSFSEENSLSSSAA